MCYCTRFIEYLYLQLLGRRYLRGSASAPQQREPMVFPCKRKSPVSITGYPSLLSKFSLLNLLNIIIMIIIHCSLAGSFKSVLPTKSTSPSLILTSSYFFKARHKNSSHTRTVSKELSLNFSSSSLQSSTSN